MSRTRTIQTTFSSGEIAPHLIGRGDLRAYANGARELTNVLVLPTGGLTRRPGLRFVDSLPGRARLVAFEFNTDQTYLIVFLDEAVWIHDGASVVATLAAPWTEAGLGDLAWTQSADTLLVCHPEVAPRAVTRNAAGTWSVEPWDFDAGDGRTRAPVFRFAPPELTLKPTGTSGTVTIDASAPVFAAGHVGAHLRLHGGEIRVDSVVDDDRATGEVVATLDQSAATADWRESAWSDARGWPVSATFHQDRLVFGGSRDLPNRLWMSRSSDFHDFDPGEGLDDQAIVLPLLSDQINAIRAVFSGRDLQIFTSGAEWRITGDPLTPATVQVHRQTRVGSPVARRVPPRDIDGATVFAARNGRQIREFLFTAAEQAYRSGDLAVVADHLIAEPVDQDHDPSRRLLYVVLGNGRIAALTVYRTEQVTAWSRLATDGAFESLAVVGERVFVAVERGGARMIEALDDTLMLDAALDGTAETPKATWSGLDHLEGRSVRVLADGVDRGAHTVAGGAVTLDAPAAAVAIGLAYTHVVEPLPPVLAASPSSQGLALRPIETVLRLHETPALGLDSGRGPQPVPLRRIAAGTAFDQAPGPVSGDIRVRHLGWTRDPSRPLWRIEQDVPLPFTLLSATTELKVND